MKGFTSSSIARVASTILQNAAQQQTTRDAQPAARAAVAAAYVAISVFFQILQTVDIEYVPKDRELTGKLH